MPKTEFRGRHLGCYLYLPHRHGLKRVMDGYVLGEVVLTEEVVYSLQSLLQREDAVKRRFAASNLMNSDPRLTLVPLRNALDNEKDPFTAGIIIAALGTLRHRSAVESIGRWKSKANESFIAQNILESYLNIWLQTDCRWDRNDIYCKIIYDTVMEFMESADDAVTHSARRILEILYLE